MPNIPFDFSKGLSTQQVKQLTTRFGTNEFEHKAEFNPILLLVAQFKSPLIYILVFASLITLFLREWIDALVILVVVLVNTFLGFWQEFKAARSLEALKNFLKPKVMVLRDGKKQEVLMKEIVPGDIVYLNAGNSIPADGVLLQAEQLIVNEAVLTGESRPVQKKALPNLTEEKVGSIEFPKLQDDTSNFVYMGTMVTAGLGDMVVLKTGEETEMGQIADSLVKTEDEETPLQQKLAGLAKTLMYVVLAVALIIIFIGVIGGKGWFEMFEIGVALSIAAIPEGLAVTMTVILALGMQRIFKHNALVRKLVAAETLGSVSVICSDKTGTLTEGKMRVVTFNGELDGLIQTAVLANDERDEEGIAMIEWANEQIKTEQPSWIDAKDAKALTTKWTRLASIPFSSADKFMASLNRVGSHSHLFVSGAPEIVLGKSSVTTAQKQKITKLLEESAQQGYRLIGFASKKTKGSTIKKTDVSGLEWHGFLAFADPIRKSVKKSLDEARLAGVNVKVITGDYRETAIAVLKPLLGALQPEQVLTGDELEQMPDNVLQKRIKEVVLFARTTPNQKLRLVNMLRSQNEVVAMTGDGVNDAPALKAADIGVVVNEATDVSKQTADMVLLDSNFKTIVEAIREGRKIYQSMRSVVTFLLTDTFQEMILIGGSLLFGLPMPVTAIQILWINLVEDSFVGTALAFDSSDSGVMRQKPQPKDGSILNNEMKSMIFMVGFMSNVILLLLYSQLLQQDLTIAKLQTMMFITMSTNSLLYVFSIKSLKQNIWNIRILNNKVLILAVIFAFSLTQISIRLPLLRDILGTVPLNLSELGLILSLGFLNLGMIEVIKWIFNRRNED